MKLFFEQNDAHHVRFSESWRLADVTTIEEDQSKRFGKEVEFDMFKGLYLWL